MKLFTTFDSVIGIDPGPTMSALTELNRAAGVIQFKDQIANEAILLNIQIARAAIAVEQVKYMGERDARLIGAAEWGGRFFQRGLDLARPSMQLPFHKVRSHFGLTHGNETALRDCIIETRFDGAKPIPVSKKHAWAALAVALCYLDLSAAAAARSEG